MPKLRMRKATERTFLPSFHLGKQVKSLFISPLQSSGSQAKRRKAKLATNLNGDEPLGEAANEQEQTVSAWGSTSKS